MNWNEAGEEKEEDGGLLASVPPPPWPPSSVWGQVQGKEGHQMGQEVTEGEEG